MMNKQEVLEKLEEIELLLSDLEQKMEQTFNAEKKKIISKQIITHIVLEDKIQKIENKMNDKKDSKKFAKPFEGKSTLTLKLQELV